MSDNQTHSHTALLVMDVQAGIVTRFAQTGDFLQRINAAITAARAASIPVIYVVVAFRQGYPEISPRNKSFSTIKRQQSRLQAAMTATEIHPAIAPQPTDIVVTKRRVSAFSGSDLEVVLRAQGISHLALCGIATSGGRSVEREAEARSRRPHVVVQVLECFACVHTKHSKTCTRGQHCSNHSNKAGAPAVAAPVTGHRGGQLLVTIKDAAACGTGRRGGRSGATGLRNCSNRACPSKTDLLRP
ncbi:MAG: cysteine hydrolase [Chloroflexi bacterium]|nr:MAG: cysteine hydrolase [Chloroflexota bacterium]